MGYEFNKCVLATLSERKDILEQLAWDNPAFNDEAVIAVTRAAAVFVLSAMEEAIPAKKPEKDA